MSLANVALVALVAVVAPLLVRPLPRGPAVPVIVVEILVGLLLGPHALGLLSVDAPVSTLALLGVTFLFFLAGLEVDLHLIRGLLLARSVAAYVAGLGLAAAAAGSLHAAGLLSSPWLVAVAFSATGLGLVVPVLRDARLIHTPVGEVVLALAGVAEFSAVLVLTLAFSAGRSPSASVVFLLTLVALAVVVTAASRRLRRRPVVAGLLDRLSGGTTQLRVRLCVALVIGFAAVAQAGGLEVVLGAFFAGGILNVLDGQAMSQPAVRGRLEGIGYGFLVPFFFVASGAELDFSALRVWPDAVVLLPLLVVTLLLARAVPSLWVVPGAPDARSLGAGVLCAMSLPFIVTAAEVGVATDRIDAATAAAMTTTGLIAVCLCPPIGITLMNRRRGVPEDSGTQQTSQVTEASQAQPAGA